MSASARTNADNARAQALMEPATAMLRSSISMFQSIDSDKSRQMVSDLKSKLATTLRKKHDADAKVEEQITALVDKEQEVVADFVGKLRG